MHVSDVKDMSGPLPTAIDPRGVTQGKILHDPRQGDATDIQGELDVVGQ